MPQEDLQKLIDDLQILLIKPFSFNGLNFEVSYVHHADYTPTYTHSPHRHPWFEFVYNTIGSIYTSFDDDEFLIKPGQSYLVPPGISHSHRNNGVAGDGLCIRFAITTENSSSYCKDILKTLSVARPYTFSSGIEEITVSSQLFTAQAEFVAWIMRMYDNWTDKKTFLSHNQNMVSPQVILYLNEYYKNKIQVEDIALALNTSYRTLSRKFKEETGITITDMLTDIRLSKARQLLLETNKSISAIAAEVGYESEFYFSKVFKQQEKAPPRHYRKVFSKK